MKRILAAGLVVLAVVALAAFAGRTQSASAKPAAGSLVGTGATFPFPLISKWIPAVDQALGMRITYTATGSGAGIAQITARTVDFGASDAPLSPDQLTACKGCVVIPWALAGMSVPYNLPGVNKRLILNGPVLANIYLGNITNWNAAAINEGATFGIKRLAEEQDTISWRGHASGHVSIGTIHERDVDRRPIRAGPRGGKQCSVRAIVRMRSHRVVLCDGRQQRPCRVSDAWRIFDFDVAQRARRLVATANDAGDCLAARDVCGTTRPHGAWPRPIVSFHSDFPD